MSYIFIFQIEVSRKDVRSQQLVARRSHFKILDSKYAIIANSICVIDAVSAPVRSAWDVLLCCPQWINDPEPPPSPQQSLPPICRPCSGDIAGYIIISYVYTLLQQSRRQKKNAGLLIGTLRFQAAYLLLTRYAYMRQGPTLPYQLGLSLRVSR